MRRLWVLVGIHLASQWNWRANHIGRFIEPLVYLGFLSGSPVPCCPVAG